MIYQWLVKRIIRQWFVHWRELFPTMQITPERIFVAGFPWDMVATTQFRVEDTLPNGEPYINRGVQILRIQLGSVVEDHLIEDNLVLQKALDIIDTV